MKKFLNILFFIIETIVLLASIACLILDFGVLEKKFHIYEIFYYTVVDLSAIPKMKTIEYIILSVCVLNIFSYITLAIMFITNNKNTIKYTYEEYKAIMDKKKAEKQEKKKQKLQQQLSDLENTD